MKNFLLPILCLAFTGLSAQMTEDNITKILTEPEGETKFELEPNQTLYAYASKDGWHKVSKEAWISSNDLIEDKYLAEGTKLLDKEGEKVGNVIKEMKVSEKRLVEGRRGKDRYVIILEGYLYRTKFKDGSFPERKIDELLAIKNKNTQKEGFKKLFEMYDFEEKEYGELTAFAMRETDKTVAEEKDFRVIVIYRGSTTVYGVLTNGHTVTAPKIKATFEDGEFKGIYMYKPPAKQKAMIEEEMMYDFLAL